MAFQAMIFVFDFQISEFFIGSFFQCMDFFLKKLCFISYFLLNFFRYKLDLLFTLLENPLVLCFHLFSELCIFHQQLLFLLFFFYILRQNALLFKGKNIIQWFKQSDLLHKRGVFYWINYHSLRYKISKLRKFVNKWKKFMEDKLFLFSSVISD